MFPVVVEVSSVSPVVLELLDWVLKFPVVLGGACGTPAGKVQEAETVKIAITTRRGRNSLYEFGIGLPLLSELSVPLRTCDIIVRQVI